MDDNNIAETIFSDYSTKDTDSQQPTDVLSLREIKPDENGESSYFDGKIVEEQIRGKIVIGPDGKFYFELPSEAANLDLEKFDSIKVVENKDGKKTLIIENAAQRDSLITGKARARIEASFRIKEDPVNSTSFFQPLDSEVVQEEILGSDNNSLDRKIIYDEFGKYRRPRVPGACQCKECGQSFANMARLERHLAVHQQYGAYLCPLCGKTYKYEYNLFYHWRRTCRDMNELLSHDERKVIEINALRQLVEEIAHKKASIGTLELSDRAYPSGSGDHHSWVNLSNSATAEPLIQESWARNEGILFADDILNVQEQEGTLMIADDGKLITRPQQHETGNSESTNEAFKNQLSIPTPVLLQAPNSSFNAIKNVDGDLKWIQYSRSVQCNECFRSFSSIQRLEKHMVGSHLSFGTHHCLFCGSRFKYEYNLMFHYRHVCSYTIELLSEEARQQMEAANLKKTIRQIASRGDFHLNPLPIYSPKAMDKEDLEHNEHPKLGDSLVRRQMMKRIIQKYPPNGQLNDIDTAQQNILLPPNLLQPSGRTDLPDGTQCPICSVVFYGLKILARHLKAAHPNESVIWEKTLKALDSQAQNSDSNVSDTIPKLKATRLESAQLNARKRKAERTEISREQMAEENEERPPQLEVER